MKKNLVKFYKLKRRSLFLYFNDGQVYKKKNSELFINTRTKEIFYANKEMLVHKLRKKDLKKKLNYLGYFILYKTGYFEWKSSFCLENSYSYPEDYFDNQFIIQKYWKVKYSNSLLEEINEICEEAYVLSINRKLTKEDIEKGKKFIIEVELKRCQENN